MEHSQKKILGVIGGLGPVATANFMELAATMTDATTDQGHMEMIVYNTPSIPDRTDYILDNSNPSPLEPMTDIGLKLVSLGAGCIAIPCMTAHYFYDRLAQRIPVPIIHALEETVLHLQKNGIHLVGIMATDGTIASRIFHRVLEKYGMLPVTPDDQGQKDMMQLIYGNIKAGLPPEMDRFYRVRDALVQDGAEATILGCTELALIKRDHPIGPGFINTLEVLAQQAVLRCGYKLKDEYSCLITK
ncbi:MAG: aspartate/glutamate racemase family protein [Oscillospiraceae bacterium]|nr:aspartate/glutamate racemase family protein [Oscillospiraceae bacterium]